MTSWQDGYKVGYQAGLVHGASLPAKSQRAIILEFIKAWPGLRGVEIAKRTGINHASVRIALYRLRTDGDIDNPKGKGFWFSVSQRSGDRTNSATSARVT